MKGSRLGKLARIANRLGASALLVIGCLAAALLTGCGTGAPQKQHQEFFTSGSNEADQRASQRMAKSEQLAGSNDQSGEQKKSGKPGSNTPVQAQQKRTLYDRLGGEPGLT